MTRPSTENAKTCAGCKYLYSQDTGYSNWTVEDTDIKCALGRNPNLPASEPYDWITPPKGSDNWSATKDSRCERYAPGPMVRLDVDHEHGPADDTNDEEVIELVCKAEGVGRNGGWQD